MEARDPFKLRRIPLFTGLPRANAAEYPCRYPNTLVADLSVCAKSSRRKCFASDPGEFHRRRRIEPTARQATCGIINGRRRPLSLAGSYAGRRPPQFLRLRGCGVASPVDRLTSQLLLPLLCDQSDAAGSLIFYHHLSVPE